MTESYNCPNCGAPIGYSPQCLYCGTLLKWIPTTAIIFKAESDNVKKLVCRIRYDNGLLSYVGAEVGRRHAEKELAEQMAKKLTEVWDFEIKDDTTTGGKEYCATVYVYAKQGDEE